MMTAIGLSVVKWRIIVIDDLVIETKVSRRQPNVTTTELFLQRVIWMLIRSCYCYSCYDHLHG